MSGRQQWTGTASSVLLASLTGSLLAALSCGPDRVSAPPALLETGGSVRVTVTTTGSDLDSTGYTVKVVSSIRSAHVDVNGAVTLSGLAIGTYTVLLSDIAVNCSVADGPSRTVTIDSVGKVIDVAFTSACSEFGTIEVTTVTTGSEPDADGFTVVANGTHVPGNLTRTVAATGSVKIRMPAGEYTVGISGVAANCSGANLGLQRVTVVSGESVAITFASECAPPTQIAFTASPTGGNEDIYVVNSNGTGLARLTTDSASDKDPAWSPDGSRIAFTSRRDDVAGAIYVMNADGSNPVRLTTSWDSRPAWSPDGSRIAFASAGDGNFEIYVMHADGTNRTRLTNHPSSDTDPAWSPDGSKIAFSSERDGNSEVYVMNADGSGPTRLTSNPTWDGHPAWSPDGTRLAFVRSQCVGYYGCYPAVFVATAAGVIQLEAGLGEDPTWSRDGGRIAVTSFDCGDYYYYYSAPCTVTGLGIVSPLPNLASVWEPVLTLGPHSNPSWR